MALRSWPWRATTARLSSPAAITSVSRLRQSAAFFRSQPEAAAIAGVADHIRSFWSPVMRRDAYALVRAGEAGFDPLARAALEQLMADDPAAQAKDTAKPT